MMHTIATERTASAGYLSVAAVVWCLTSNTTSVDLMGSESPYGVFISQRTPAVESGYYSVGRCKYEASRRGKKVLNPSRGKNARHVP